MASPWIDVSVTLKTGMVHWPGDPPFRISHALDIERGERNGQRAGPCGGLQTVGPDQRRGRSYFCLSVPKPGSPGYQEKWQSGSAPIRAMMADPQHYYTPELRKFTEEKIRKISCPVLIVEGDQHPIKKLNNEIFIPALKAAGKQAEVILYPGEKHGFSYRGTPAMTRKFFQDADAFFRRHLPTQPKPLERALITEVPVE